MKIQARQTAGNFIYQPISGSYRFWWKALDDEDLLLSIVLAYVYVHSLLKLCSELDIFVEFGACSTLHAMEKVE